MVHLDFPMTNNEAKYKALVAGMDLAKAAGAMSVVCTTILRWSQVR